MGQIEPGLDKDCQHNFLTYQKDIAMSTITEKDFMSNLGAPLKFTLHH
jgi:hypothetical protein